MRCLFLNTWQPTLQQSQLHFCTEQIMAVPWSLTCAAIMLSLLQENNLSNSIPHRIKYWTEAVKHLSRSLETWKMLKIILSKLEFIDLQNQWYHSDGVSRPIFANLGLGLDGFRSRLGLEGFRSRDFEYYKEMVYQNFCNSKSFCLFYLSAKNNQNTSEKCQKFERNSSQKWWQHFF